VTATFTIESKLAVKIDNASNQATIEFVITHST
jgi:hypothetical protein